MDKTKMKTLEDKIKNFAKEQGVDVVGLAGPERFKGPQPPSNNPSYVMRGAKSIVSLVMPMDVDGIYDWFSKKTHVTHSVDQAVLNQEIRHKAEAIVDFVKGLGYKAKAVATNNSYRRSRDPLSTKPDFSHRFGAIAAGVAGQGWSGNIMTKEYGAAVYLSTVVTSADLKSDPAIDPRYFMEEFCYKCRLCEKTCVAGMFDSQEEEYVLLGKDLHPRGKRLSIDYCNASCFGLHSLSRDKKWSTWGIHWMSRWIDQQPEPNETKKIRKDLIIKGTTTGDSTSRYDLISRIGGTIISKKLIAEFKEKMPNFKTQKERNVFMVDWAERVGVKNLRDDRILTCGNCCLICGPTLQETRKRYEMLVNSGIVIQGPDEENLVVDSYEEAAAKRKEHLPNISKAEMVKDAKDSAKLWASRYLGFNPKEEIKAKIYERANKAANKQMEGNTKIAVGKTPN
jgi:hypothetical protein